jgi:CRP/FNR family transcriptional regulator, anaerobic regulatory protein
MSKSRSSRPDGPGIRAADPWLPGTRAAGRLQQLLSDEERAQLATIASIVRFKKGEKIYSDGKPVKAIFNIISGVVKAYKTAPDGSEHIAAFLHPQDLLGLSEEGHYTNSAKALTPVTAYALPVPALRRRLSKDAALEFHVIAKLCHELRQAQHHALLLAQRHASSKLAMFLQLQENLQFYRGEPTAEIYLPMGRSDIAEYVGMSLAAVSRGFGSLAAHRIIKNTDRRHVKILDRKAFEKLVADQIGPATRSTTK